MQHGKLLLQESILNITPEKSLNKKLNVLEPTPNFTVTPESKLKSRLQNKNVSKSKEIEPDPLLNVTPEKPILSKKLHAKDSRTHNRVRFNIPSDGLSESETRVQYGRSPLKDISENTQLSEEISSSSDSTSWYSSENTSLSSVSNNYRNGDSIQLHDIKDMSGVVINGLNVPKIQPRIKVVNKKKPITGTEKQTSKQRIIEVIQPSNDVAGKINRLTKDPKCMNNAKTSKTMLKKKTGLQRHQHTVHYDSNDDYADEENVLAKPNYNSSLAVGQELQVLKLQEFNPDEMLSQKLSENDELKLYIAEKTAMGTNIPFEDKLYSNLVSVEADGSWKNQLSHTATFKKLKQSTQKNSIKVHAKPAEPNIMDNFSEANYHEEVMLELKCIKLERPGLSQAPIDEAMSLDVLSNLWTGML